MINNFPRIFLCGFMGSGKSTLGKALARLLQRDYIDLDLAIEKLAGKPISLIFSEDGEAHFRQLEKEMLAEICSRKSAFVCSLGGGSICNEASLHLVRENGLLVYISLPVAALSERLRSSRGDRPLLRTAEGQSLEERIRELLQSRESFYNRAHLTVQGLSLTAAAMLKTISEHK